MPNVGDILEMRSRLDGTPRRYHVGRVDPIYTLLVGPDGVSSERFTRDVFEALFRGSIRKIN